MHRVTRCAGAVHNNRVKAFLLRERIIGLTAIESANNIFLVVCYGFLLPCSVLVLNKAVCTLRYFATFVSGILDAFLDIVNRAKRQVKSK